MKDKIQRFMYGRYGQDSLTKFLSIAALILCVISLFTRLVFINSLGMVLLLICFYRIFSKDTWKRQQENLAFLRIKDRVIKYLKLKKLYLSEMKTNRFYSCSICKARLRVPKGKGLIEITCPKCKSSFNKKT